MDVKKEFKGFNKVYKSQMIGSQCWITEELQETHFINGDELKLISDPTHWLDAYKNKVPAYNVIIETGRTHFIYNRWAIVDPRGLFPEGSRLPTKLEFDKLLQYIESPSIWGNIWPYVFFKSTVNYCFLGRLKDAFDTEAEIAEHLLRVDFFKLEDRYFLWCHDGPLMFETPYDKSELFELFDLGGGFTIRLITNEKYESLANSYVDSNQKENSDFPIVILSDALKDAQQKEIPLEVDEPKKPVYPNDESPLWGCSLTSFFLIITFFCISLPIGVIGCASLIFLVFTIYLWITSKIEHRRTLIKYKEQLKEFEINKRIFSQQMKFIRQDCKTKEFRLTLIRDILLRSSCPNIKSNHKVGRSEIFFENYLNKWFPKRIFKGYGLIASVDHRPYQPDFIYQDDNNLHIDIEVDEPYSEITKEPIHYIDDDADSNRDYFFTEERGWVVIRFCENQVINFPNDCCYVIAEIIYRLTNNKTYLDALSSWKSPKQFAKWTFNEAKGMSEIKFRETYLRNISIERSYINNWNDKLRTCDFKT